MQLHQNDRQPWLTKDFELKFRQAFGREMTSEERSFFGLDEFIPAEDGSQEPNGGC